MERGEFSPCGTPTGLDSRDPFDHQLGKQKPRNQQCRSFIFLVRYVCLIMSLCAIRSKDDLQFPGHVMEEKIGGAS